LIGVSPGTLRRWIYSGKARAIKDASGRYRINKSEVERLRKELSSEVSADIIELLHQVTVAYQREIQVRLEEKHSHDEVLKELRKLEKEKIVKTEIYEGYKWYFLPEKQWNDVEEVVKKKIRVKNILTIIQENT